MTRGRGEGDALSREVLALEPPDDSLLMTEARVACAVMTVSSTLNLDEVRGPLTDGVRTVSQGTLLSTWPYTHLRASVNNVTCALLWETPLVNRLVCALRSGRGCARVPSSPTGTLLTGERSKLALC